MEMNFCRRCGSVLNHENDIIYLCQNGHHIYSNSAPATLIILENENGEILVGKRSLDPHKGALDLPGGFVDGNETFEQTIAREVEEELGLTPETYEQPKYLTSSLDDYLYKGEKIRVLTVSFSAKLIGMPTITAKSDIEELAFLPVNKININEFCFISSKEALRFYSEQANA